jgi:hypothetical protein
MERECERREWRREGGAEMEREEGGGGGGGGMSGREKSGEEEVLRTWIRSNSGLAEAPLVRDEVVESVDDVFVVAE